MRPEAQRIAIAKALGYLNPRRRESGRYWGTHGIPDFLNDLNAMSEAEAWLKKEDPHAFACYASDLFEEHGSDAIHLCAAQRAEALLRTLNLWEP